jgi:tetratricopeptide (TPR) repeat protein
VHTGCGIEVAPRETKPAEDAPPPEAPPAIEGLAIEKLLGRGGFGAVYLAKMADGRKAAVKVPMPDPDAIMRLELEGATLRELGGVHAPALYDTLELEDGRPCLVMEFVPMPLLSDRLSELENGMPIDELGRRALSILGALNAVHALDLVHRDLKPENIFSTDQPTVTRIFDFGLVRPPAGTPQQDTTVGTFMGTPEYMAPEQLDSSAPVDRRADVYAIGAVFYEMLAGRPPFWGNAAEVQQALANRRALRPSRYVASAPPALEDVILRCLAKDPERRYTSTDELAAAFEAALAQSKQAAAAPPPAAAAPPAADAKTAPAAAPARKPMALLAVSGIPVDTLNKALASGGGQLAEAGRGGGVGLFGEKTSENPVARAIRLADSLIARKACRSAIVDLAAVATRRKPDGSERYVSAAFARLLKQVEAQTGGGVFLTAAAADLLPERRGAATADGALIAALPPARDDDALTVVRAANAPLFGRDEEMDRLVGAARASFNKQAPGLATVLAEGGLGKSHLCATLVEQLKLSDHGAAIIELRAREPIEGEGDGNLRALLARCFTLPADKPADRGQALLGELGPTLWPAAALALGWMSPDEPELRALGAAPGLLRATVSRSVGEALRRLARQRPLAVIFDDAHFADDATLDAIEYATMPEALVPLWVCVAARPALAQMKPSWGERSGDHLRVELGPLGTDAATELARRLLLPVEQIPAVTLETLIAGTHGSPFLLSELVRGLKRDGIVRRDAKTGIWFLAADELAKLPDLAVTDWLADREIGGLPPELAAHARLSALLGVDFAEDEIDGVMSELERNRSGADQNLDADLRMDPHVATRQLVAMGIFKRQRGGRASFRHALLRVAVEKSVSDRFRADIHAAAFRFYRSETTLDDGVRLPRLAFHAAAAGYRASAGPVYLDLADRARRHHAYVEAETLYSRALGQLDESEQRPRMVALRGRGVMRWRVSRHDAVDDLMAALALARALDDREAEASIILEAATALDWMNEFRKSRDLVNQAEAMLATFEPGKRSAFLQASVLVGQGRAMQRFNENQTGIEKLSQAAALAERLGDEGYEMRVISLLMLGTLLPFAGRVEEAERAFETLLGLCEERGDNVHLMAAYLNRRYLWLGRRNLARALDDTRRNIQLAREIGSVVATFMGEYNLAELLFYANDPEAAWGHVRRAVELERKRLSSIDRPVARLLEARLLTFLGRDAEARALYETIAASQAEAERAGENETLFLPSERVLLSMVDLCTREATEAEWNELRARSNEASTEQEPIEVAEMAALALGRRGHAAQARQMLGEALRLAETIPNVMAKRLHQAQVRLQVGEPLARVV